MGLGSDHGDPRGDPRGDPKGGICDSYDGNNSYEKKRLEMV